MPIGLKEILKTLHSDLIGKDSHRGITLTYGWMANQVGHFALGFIPTCLLIILSDLVPWKATLYVSLFWLAFEIYNALSPLYKKEYKGNGTFKVRWKNLTFDTFTDLCFFWFGATTFYLLISKDKMFLIWYSIGIVMLLFFIRYWFLTKLFQQNAYLPYQFRLSQWDSNLNKITAGEIRQFLYDKRTTKHFLVFGQKGSGKTRLSVGIGNEFAINHCLSTYTTFTKWLSLLEESDSDLDKSKISIWPWTGSDILIIDDIHAGVPLSSNKFKTTDVYSFINEVESPRNLEALKRMSVVWVVGRCHPDEIFSDWKNLLIKIGVPETDIIIVDLDH